jgi:hypothetical protein
MRGWLLADQITPEPTRVANGWVMRRDGVLEVDPELMRTYVRQQDMPRWDFERIVTARQDYLQSMETHMADRVLSGAEILQQVTREAADADR